MDAFELLWFNSIDLLVQSERFRGGQVPPELVFLAHHECEAAPVGVVALPRDVTENLCAAAGGVDHTRKKFERRSLTGAVRSQKGDKLALFDIEIDAANGFDFAVF